MNARILHQAQLAWAHVQGWAMRDLLVIDTLAQAAMAAVLLLVLWLAGPAASRRLAGRAAGLQADPLRRLASASAAAAPWLALAIAAWIAAQAFAAAGLQTGLLGLLTSFALAWVVIRVTSSVVRDAALAQGIAICAWVVAALNILGLIPRTLGLLNAMAITIGTMHLSVLLVGKGIVLLVVLLWLARVIARVVEQRLAGFSHVSPAMQVLAVKLVRLALLALAVALALGAVGIDLTAFAVFSGAIGVGIGLGLQKVVSNLVSGVILLMDRSIKPGDVIQIEGTYGWITRLNARYVSVATRDGTEYLIPNEDLITQRVINWSYSNELIRLHVPIGIGYDADPHAAIAAAVAAARQVPRVLDSPSPVCLLKGFGASTVDLELRFWISDPRQGTANARSQVMLAVWDSFKAHGIALPFPQLDVHLVRPPRPPDPPAA